MAEDYYKTLDVPKSASADEIQKAYRRLARKYHPDLYVDKDEQEKKKATKSFQRVQQAYDVLSDEEKRQQYDLLGPNFEQMGGARNPFAGAGPGGPQIDFSQLFGRGGPGGAGGGMEDLFRQFGMQGGPHGGPGGPHGGPRDGEDINERITVPFATAVLGGEHQVSVQRRDKVETIEVKIPKGIEHGQKIRLRNQGQSGFDGGRRGNLKITVRIAPHPVYSRSGLNLSVKVPITLKEAVEGAKIDLPTPHGTISVTVPPGSSGGKSLRLKGMGIKTEKRNGDLIATLQIAMPEQLAADDRKRVEQLESAWNGEDPRDSLIW